MIPVTSKASNVCAYCRVRKQRCDRMWPQCSRCAAKLTPCDYTPHKELPSRLDDSPSLYGELEGSGHDLTARGREDLIQAASDWVQDAPGSRNKFSVVVHAILELADVSVTTIMDEYARCIHSWSPLMDEDVYLSGADRLSRRDRPPSPLLLLLVFLVTRRTCAYPREAQRRTRVLYTTLKQLLVLLQTSNDVEFELVQSTMLLAVYECANGMATQAYLTLSSCSGMLAIVESNVLQGRERRSQDEVCSLKVAALVLDRMIALSALTTSLPLIYPTNSPLARSILDALSGTIPPPSLHPSAVSPRKLYIRARVALESGRILEYIYTLKNGLPSQETYEDVESGIAGLIKSLVKKAEPYTWMMCDAIALAFCSQLLLHQAQALNTALSLAPKTNLAFCYARRMAWDMVRVGIEKIDVETYIGQLPVAGLCCVLRAAVAVMETQEVAEAVDPDELVGLERIMIAFKERWGVGEEYWKRIQAAPFIRPAQAP
ncbi:hypothetical protein BDV95DRAFT_613101 [Massariosphaeria phaeospora]|uniref:Zn(2)-C6 fungal-type domain-containing protein n=1 Tax=Massariosphaeria phaeospora TaxID=100035 RepID=A0A7C8I0X6_9PLEO|nr:hypothetical protein BDV95DRAFT_613101 [Massariosphaeria phaeospora]